ncbi:MAG: TatD family hydrolase [Candidatus Magasanikbacteria bacterium]|jgi:TatD DNase family protein|nr:TatD family hydrolase [Candidatus Magasanikbacteria bacterium]MBT4315301.1 TatD family hydrolase [Candidatus Magasanikbacteria bacterium]MBT4547173.1 TatD family hydrolase [Candidatus Magasanikbacteria bacterium]MBT6819687.1 TatD family hydrolase [Candidatus Magasanikbacteria bacterium]
MLIDSHCHIQFNAYKDDYDEVIKRCIEKNTILNTVGTQKETSKKAVDFAEKYDNIYATIGLHPIHLFPTHVDEEESSFISREEDFDEEYYGELAKSEKVIAVGECGIDLFHLPKDKSLEEVLKKQKEIFIKQADFAKKHNLPLVIHVRDAYKEILEVLDPETKGVVHCYTGNWQNAQKFLDLGLYLGFTGIATFPAKKTSPKPQEQLLEVIKNCPLDRILIETDAPYLAPQKYRGERCEPWMVEEVAKKIAEIKVLTEEEVRDVTVENAKRLFTKII